jgi:hydrogenase maturation protease
VTFDRLSRGGLALMERLVGASRVVLVDALNTGRRPVGTVLSVPLEDLGQWVAGHLDSAHDASLVTALAAGRALGAELPAQVMVVGIEAERIYDFGEELSPEVEAAIGPAADSVLAIVAGWAHDPA